MRVQENSNEEDFKKAVLEYYNIYIVDSYEKANFVIDVLWSADGEEIAWNHSTGSNRIEENELWHDIDNYLSELNGNDFSSIENTSVYVANSSFNFDYVDWYVICLELGLVDEEEEED